MTIETKFAPGDEVWMMHENKCKEFEIGEVMVAVKGTYEEGWAHEIIISYFLRRDFPNICFIEGKLFASKADLLASL